MHESSTGWLIFGIDGSRTNRARVAAEGKKSASKLRPHSATPRANQTVAVDDDESARWQRSTRVLEEMQAEDEYRKELHVYEKARQKELKELRKQLARQNSVRALFETVAFYAAQDRAYWAY